MHMILCSVGTEFDKKKMISIQDIAAPLQFCMYIENKNKFEIYPACDKMACTNKHPHERRRVV